MPILFAIMCCKCSLKRQASIFNYLRYIEMEVHLYSKDRFNTGVLVSFKGVPESLLKSKLNEILFSIILLYFLSCIYPCIYLF